MRGSRPFAVSAMTIAEWAAMFNHGASFSNYVGYIRKACYFLEEPLFWGTAAVKNMIASLKLRGKGKYRFPNFIRIDLVARILVRESRDSPFAHLSYISFPFALRVPSEALKLRRAFSNDEITTISPMQGGALSSPSEGKPRLNGS